MLPFPDISPDLIHIGPLRIRWYGLMYIMGFIATYVLIQKQQRSKALGLTGQRLQDLTFQLILGLIIGARLGYVLFYQAQSWSDYLSHPLEIIAVWHGGMSFHGGLLGTLAAGWWFCRRHRIPFLSAADRVIVTVPVGLFLGRIGNFINGELYGRTSSVPWAMIFPNGGPIPRHPSQLYEAGLEGLLLFVILWVLQKREFRDGMMIAFFLGGYGVFRFIVEFFREPDSQLGLLWGALSMGQMLCALMIAAAIIWALIINRKA